MITAPSYSSHEQQQAAVGSAAILDAEKFPRRYALHVARQSMDNRSHDPEFVTEPDELGVRAKSAKKRETLAQKAAQLSHLTLKEAAAELGIKCDKMRKLRAEFDLVFQPRKPSNLIVLGQIESLAAEGLKIVEIAEAVKRAPNYIARIIREHNFRRGPSTNLEEL
jgi:hypothetical protein